MKKFFATLFIIGTIFSQSFGQLSINVLPTYNSIKSNYVTTGFGIETGIRFRSSKVFVLGFDTGFHAGKLRTPQTVVSFAGTTTIYNGEFSYVPVQGVLELQSIKNRVQFLGGIGLGTAINTKNLENSLFTSWYLGASYRINENIRILTKYKQGAGIFLTRREDDTNGFASTNISLGINYKFK
jgi:hypothetical protein